MQRIFVGTTYGINENGTDLERDGAACILHSDDGITWEAERSYNEAILENDIARYPGRVMLANSESDPDITYAIIASGYPAGPFLGYGCEFLLKSWDDRNAEGENTLFLGTVSGRLFKLQDCSDPESAVELTGNNFPAGYACKVGNIPSRKQQLCHAGN
jgi:hypothetical protein